MADLQKDNGQEKERVKTVSVLDKKRQGLLGGLSELMEQTGGVYGPFLMEQLQRRLEFVVQNFNEEVKSLIKRSFEEWRTKDSQLRDLLKENKQTQTSQLVTENSEDSSTPDFIKDVEFGPIRPK